MKRIIVSVFFLINMVAFSQDKKIPDGWDEILLEGKVAYMNLITGDISETFPNKIAKKKEKIEEYDPTITHKVKKGETLSSISRKHNIELAKLYRLNSMVNFDSIEIGDEVVIGYKEELKPEVNTTSKKEIANSKYHTVMSGDTLYSIARKYGIRVSDLKTKNNLNSNSIFIGQKLNVF